MNKTDLIELISDQNPHLYQHDVDAIVSTILDEICSSLVEGDRVELRGFGNFFAADRKARVGRNPRTGESVQVAAKAVPRFRSSKLLIQRLNNES